MPGFRKSARRARRRAPTRRPRRRTQDPTSTLIRDNHAKCSSTIQVDAYTGVRQDYSHALNQYQRAVDISTGYQEFRIDYVELTYKNNADTYQSGATTGSPVPQLYYQILKDGSSNTALQQFTQNGVNPHSLAKDGNVTWRYKPCVVYAGQNGQPSILKQSPWINTDQAVGASVSANQTLHYGTSMWIDAGSAAPYTSGTINIEVHFSFRKPRYTLILNQPAVYYENGVRIEPAH